MAWPQQINTVHLVLAVCDLAVSPALTLNKTWSSVHVHWFSRQHRRRTVCALWSSAGATLGSNSLCSLCCGVGVVTCPGALTHHSGPWEGSAEVLYIAVMWQTRQSLANLWPCQGPVHSSAITILCCQSTRLQTSMISLWWTEFALNPSQRAGGHSLDWCMTTQRSSCMLCWCFVSRVDINVWQEVTASSGGVQQGGRELGYIWQCPAEDCAASGSVITTLPEA